MFGMKLYRNEFFLDYFLLSNFQREKLIIPTGTMKRGRIKFGKRRDKLDAYALVGCIKKMYSRQGRVLIPARVLKNHNYDTPQITAVRKRPKKRTDHSR